MTVAPPASDLTYEYIKLKDVAERETPEALEVKALLAAGPPGLRGRSLEAYQEAIPEAVIHWHEDLYRWLKDNFSGQELLATLVAWTPPRFETPASAYLEWAHNSFSDLRERKRQNTRYYGSSSSPSDVVNGLWLVGWHNGSAHHEKNWEYTALLKRDKLIPTSLKGSRVSYDEPGYTWHSVIQKETAYRRGKLSVARPALLTLEYVYGEGRSFAGTLGEWFAAEDSYSEELKIVLRAAHYHTSRYTNVQGQPLPEKTLRPILLPYKDSRTIATLNESQPKPHREFLGKLNHEDALPFLLMASTYYKGKTLAHAQEVLGEVHRALGVGEEREFEILTTEDIRRELTLILARAALFEGPYYSADRLAGVLHGTLAYVTNTNLLSRNKKEISSILHSLKLWREAQLAGQGESSLGDEQAPMVDVEAGGSEANRETAKKFGELTLLQASALIVGIAQPQSWLRGSKDDAPFLLEKWIAAHGVNALQWMADLMYGDHPSAPTVAELDRAINENDEAFFESPINIMLPLVISEKAMENTTSRGFSDPLRTIRTLFGHKD